MKKILVVINSLGVGGAERMAVNQVNEMIRRGFKVRLLTLKLESEKSFLKDCLIEQKNWKIINFGSLFNFFSWLKVFFYLKKEHPDLVISHLWFSNLISRIVCKILNLKILSFEQNVYDSVKTKKMFFIDRLLQGLAFKIVAVSEVVKRSLISHGIKEDKIVVIYNSVDLEAYQNVEVDQEMSKDKNFKFLYVGRLINQKGLDTLIKAFAKTKGANLYLLGQGQDRERLEKLAEEKGVRDRVFFWGVRDNVSKVIAAADSFVYPSRHDGFSLVLLEALASKKPVIVSDFFSNLEVVEDGKSGLVFPVDNIESLTEKMNLIMNNEKIRIDLSFFAGERVKDFSITNHINKIIEYAK
ncbi:glycosyltransferase [Candidatus Nomurabacteria bacterium]|nr:glycosyltransferase [Candidatus Nomurabacteria bacterium]